MLNTEQWAALNRLVAGCTSEQLIWISGYLAGLGQRQLPSGQPSSVQADAQPSRITVLFGSQTGNAEKVAKALHARLESAGHSVRLESMANYRPAQLKNDAFLLVAVSTYGEGTPPDNAADFHGFLHSNKVRDLSHLSFAVLALGDASYEHFCQTGKDFDLRLEALGAKRLEPRVDCDVDYEEVADKWVDTLATRLESLATPSLRPVSATMVPTAPSSYSKRHPYSALLLANLPLTGRGSSKEVRHIELGLAESGIGYEPGDALGVVPQNWPLRVMELLDTLRLDPAATVQVLDGETVSLQEALSSRYEITTLTQPFLERYAELTGASKLADLLTESGRDKLRDYMRGREILDVVLEFPVVGIAPEQFLPLLRKLPPRLYSIASSLKASPDEVHLTVAVVRYQSHGRDRMGVASTFLADRVADDGTVPVYVEANANFRLPTDPETPIVMIGPGTGVAPFRAFLAEREAVGASGRNWLFFGDRRFQTDFLYQTEWLEYRRKGLLTRIDVAFSRDEEKKVYVQNRMREQSRELYAWLEQGAHVYVCGDGRSMAPDVHEALLAVVEHESGCDRDGAIEYVNKLRSSRRYQRDVY